MSGQHTPGPWQASKRKARRVTNAHGVVICNAVLRNAGTAKGGIKHGAKAETEAEANATLIAAAPELLSALSDVAGCMLLGADGQAGDFGWNISALTKLRPAIRDAIVKATTLAAPPAKASAEPPVSASHSSPSGVEAAAVGQGGGER